MKKTTDRFDVVVAGAGTAGASAALHLARSGLSVALLDARPFSQSGARWMNGVPPWMFDRAGIDFPEKPEPGSNRFPASIRDYRGRVYQKFFLPPVFHVDMRRLVKHLQNLALKAGATPIEKATPIHFDLTDGRPVRLHLSQKGKEKRAFRRAVRARLFVDATGLNGALRCLAPVLKNSCPPLEGKDLCFAAHQVKKIRDLPGARAFLERTRAEPGEFINFVGVDGGFSTLTVKVLLENRKVEILTGAIADGRHKTGPEILADFLAEEPWIGKKIFGGSGLIPIRRPFDRLAAPGVALVGDAGCQVFPAHGSGTGAGLIAARILAEAVTPRDDPGSLGATWAYQAAFMKEIGGVFAGYDILRRLSQGLSSEEFRKLLASGLMAHSGTLDALDQKMPKIPVGELVGMAAAATKSPGLAVGFAPSVLKMGAVFALYRRYPKTPDLARLKRWSRAVARLFGDPPDLG